MVGGYTYVEEVKQCDKGTAIKLFEKKLPNLRDYEYAHSLLQQLDYIPLAINQAAAYIARNKIPIERYVSTFESAVKWMPRQEE